MKRTLLVALVLVAVLLTLEATGHPVLAQGIFDGVQNTFTDIGRQAWSFLVALIIITAMLGGAYYVLQGTAGAAFGGSRLMAVAIIGGVGIILAVLVAFLLLPELGRILNEAKPAPPF